MFSTCIYCHRPLGTNAAIEVFPVGERLAFDLLKGRLWVICPTCGRWNLTPLEERWEAIEWCERRFRQERARVHTANIGLTRVPGGLTLIRIGPALRPEFAAWRYGDTFDRRRRLAWTLDIAPWRFYREWLRAIRVPQDNGKCVEVIHADLSDTELVEAPEPEGWGLLLRSASGRSVFTGWAARRALGAVLPLANERGASPNEVTGAVTLLGRDTHPEELFRRIARASTALRGSYDRDRALYNRERNYPNAPIDPRGTLPLPPVDRAGLLQLPATERLALEMALHEETERRALKGELHELELAWREAELVAAISDNLLVPDQVQAQLAQMKQQADRARKDGDRTV